MLSFIRFVGLSVDEVNLVSGDKLRLVLDAYVEYVASGGNGAGIECGGGLHVSARRALLLGGDSVCSDSFVYGGEHGGASMVRRTGDCVCGAARGEVEEIRGQLEGGVGGDTSSTGAGGGVGAGSAVVDESGLPGCDAAGVSASSGDDFGRVGNSDELPVSDGAGCAGSELVVDQNVCGGVARGKHYESNRRKRLSRKKKSAPAHVDVGSVKDWRNPGVAPSVGEVDQNVPTLREFVERRVDSEIFDKRCVDLEERMADEMAAKSAKRTLNEKWAMENKLAAAKAKRALEILEAQDLQAEIKKQSTYLKLQTEKNMVGMEKAHQFLKKTGNVPGFAQTVLSDEGLTDGSSASPASPGECTISPDSSASMKDFRELAKKCADQQAKLDQFHKMTKIHPDYIELYKKQTWTINSENIRILDEMYPQGHALNPIPDYENYDAPTHGELIVGSDEEYFPY